MKTRHFISVLLLLLFLLSLSACSEIAPKTQNSAILQLGAESNLLTKTVTSESSYIDIPAQEGFPGMTISIPADAVDVALEWEISSSSVLKHNLGQGYEILTPLIGIDTGMEQLKKALEITIPVNVTEGHLPLAFYYEPSSGSFEAIPSQLLADGSLKIVCSHFSYIIAVSVFENLLMGQIQTDFQIGRDNPQIVNIVTYSSPSGMCQGMAEATLFYHKILRPSLGPLYEQYGNLQRETAGFWKDDRNFIRLLSMIQTKTSTPDLTDWLQENWNRSSMEHWYMTSFAILQTGQPQLVIITDTNEWSDTTFPSAHALIAYKVDGRRMYVYDPNAPENGNLYLEIDLNTGKLLPYVGASSADKADITYNYMYFAGSSALLDFDTISDLWKKLHNGTIGDGIYPEYQIYEIITDSQGIEKKVLLGAEHFTTQNSLQLKLESSAFRGRLTAYGSDYSVLATAGPGQILKIPLTTDDMSVGILIEKADDSGAVGLWTDFFWANVLKSSAQKWEAESTITQVFPGAGLTSEQAATIMGQKETYILYLTWDPINNLYMVLDPESGMLRELNRTGNTLWSEYTVTRDDEVFSDHFSGTINESENQITGSSSLSTSKGGPIFTYSVIWTKLD